VRATQVGTVGRLSQALQILGITVLAGFLVGVSIALGDFQEFSRVPGSVLLIFPLVAGGLLGMVVPQLSHALASLLPMLLISGVFGFGALVYPEYVAGRLGVEIASEVALQKALQGVIFALPLSIVGLLLGHFLAARWNETS